MGSRARKRAPSGLSVEDALLLVSDKAALERVLDQFVERKTLAEAAEVKAGERGQGQAAREAALDLREAQLDKKIAEFNERVAAFEAWKSRFDKWLDDREVA